MEFIRAISRAQSADPAGLSWGRSLLHLSASIRVPSSGRVDLHAVAERLGVRVVTRPMKPVLWGVTVSPQKVIINGALPRARKRFAIAHEFAHILVRRDRCPWLDPSEEETFADAFARELLLPRADLNALWPADPQTLSTEFDIDERTLMLQLAAEGLAPALTRAADGCVLCAACGDRARTPSCSCVRFRHDPGLQLPGLRELSSV